MDDKVAAAGKLIKALKKTGIGLAIAGGTGSVGYGGYKMGERSGAKKAANKMAEAFSAANEIENEQIANQYYNQALEDSGMKTASFDEIGNEAFIDELEKMGGPAASLKKSGEKVIESVRAFIKYPKAAPEMYAESWKRLAKNVGNMGENVVGLATRKYGGRKYSAGALKNKIIHAIKKSPAAIGTIGVGAAGLGAGGYALGHKKEAAIASTLLKSFKTLGKGVGSAYKGIASNPKKLGTTDLLKATASKLWSTAGKSKAALGTIGGGVGAAGTAGVMLAGKKKD